VSFDWSEFLKLARELAGLTVSPPLPSGEARFRAAISRAYYATHKTAYNFLRDVDRDQELPRDGEAHIYVIDQFRNSAIGGRRDVGEKLNRLRLDRNNADYRDEFLKVDSVSKKAIAEASKALSRLTELSASSTSTEPPP